MTVQTKPCKNAVELTNPVQVRKGSGEIFECTHRCMQPHTDEHELFHFTEGGLCPFEDDCPHFEAKSD